MTENKRYFQKEYDEQYYIFDSETITEKEFEEKYEYEDYQAFVDSMQGYEVVNRLNEQHDKISEQAIQIDFLQDESNDFRNKYNTTKKDETQLSIDFMGYKMKIAETLQKHYDKYVDGIDCKTAIYILADELGVELK